MHGHHVSTVWLPILLSRLLLMYFCLPVADILPYGALLAPKNISSPQDCTGLNVHPITYLYFVCPVIIHCRCRMAPERRKKTGTRQGRTVQTHAQVRKQTAKKAVAQGALSAVDMDALTDVVVARLKRALKGHVENWWQNKWTGHANLQQIQKLAGLTRRGRTTPRDQVKSR